MERDSFFNFIGLYLVCYSFGIFIKANHSCICIEKYYRKCFDIYGRRIILKYTVHIRYIFYTNGKRLKNSNKSITQTLL